jgi:hypothetical protein
MDLVFSEIFVVLFCAMHEKPKQAINKKSIVFIFQISGKIDKKKERLVPCQLSASKYLPAIAPPGFCSTRVRRNEA